MVWMPKYRKKRLFWGLRQQLGPVLRELATRKESEIPEERLRPDHGHILTSIPSKHAVSQAVDYIKGKNAIYITRNYLGRRNSKEQHFRARGYYVSTAGIDEAVIREYSRICAITFTSEQLLGCPSCQDTWPIPRSDITSFTHCKRSAFSDRLAADG